MYFTFTSANFRRAVSKIVIFVMHTFFMALKQSEKTGIEAVRMLRKTKLSLGLPFMINSHLLPANQCYLEYPDGAIRIATISKQDNDFKIIAELDPMASIVLRKKYKLF
jgi:hypothetical protein